MDNAAYGTFEKKLITESSQWRKNCEIRPSGTAKTYQITPAKPVRKPKIIVNGIKGKIKALAGKATKERFPIL